jgi:drug/metabolite transporter (DMT)-like permease
MAFMVGSVIFLVSMNACVRVVTSDMGMHPFQAAFFRVSLGLVFFLPVLAYYRFEPLRTKHFGMQALRGGLNAGAMLLYFFGIAVTPLAKVIAITFTAPLFATIMGVLILHEVIRARRVTALILGFIGGFIILRPGIIETEIGSIAIFISSALWGLTMVVMKVLGRTESSFTTTAYVTIFLTPFTLIAALPFWESPSADMWPWLLAIGILGTIGQVCLAQAFREADMTIILPIDFTKLIWAAALGFMLFGEIPDIWTWVGGAVIFASTTYIAFREHREESVRKSKETETS